MKDVRSGELHDRRPIKFNWQGRGRFGVRQGVRHLGVTSVARDKVTASGAATSTAMEPNTGLVPCEARDSEVPDSSPDSDPPAPPPIESGWAPIMEFTVADIFQHSPFGDILSSLKYLSLSGEPWPDCGQDGWDAVTSLDAGSALG